jgi:hypothetical protein
VPEDDPKIPPFATPRIPELALSDEQNKFFRKQGGRELGEAVKRLGLQDPSRALGNIQIARKQLEQAKMEIAQLDLKIAELDHERGGRREAARALQAWLVEHEQGTPTPARPNSLENSPPPAATARPALQPGVEHSGRALVRRFLSEHPMLGSAARIREAMGGDDVDGSAPAPGSWTAKEAERLHRQLNVPSESTIQRELNERQAR